jgi:hypothetical protein
MTETIEQPREDETGPDTPASPPADDLDSLLQQWDDTVGKAEQGSDGNSPDGNVSTDPSVDQQIADLLRSPEDTQRISELTSQVDSLRAEEHRRGELQAFNDMAKDLDQQLPSWLVATGYAEARLKALAHDQTVALAFDLRNVDRAAAKQEMLKVQWELSQPNIDPKRQQELREYGAKLDIAIHANAILRQARLGILNEAGKLPKPIDEEVTGWRSEIAASMRGASMPVDFKEPPPDLGRMDDQTFRRWKLENLGWE